MPSLGTFLTDPQSILEALERYDLLIDAPVLQANAAQYEWSTEGMFHYLLERPVNVVSGSEKFRTPSLPWDTTIIADNQLAYVAKASDTIV